MKWEEFGALINLVQQPLFRGNFGEAVYSSTLLPAWFELSLPVSIWKGQLLGNGKLEPLYRIIVLKQLLVNASCLELVRANNITSVTRGRHTCTCMWVYIWWIGSLCLLLSLATGMWSVSTTVIGTVCERAAWQYRGKEKVCFSSCKRLNSDCH